MSFTNNAEAGPSSCTPKTLAENTDDSIIPASITSDHSKLELAEKVRVFKASPLENTLDYSIIVSNSISMARDQLANERNWLTWFRLSCTLVILGFSILIQFRLPGGEEDNTDQDSLGANKPIGYIFTAIGFGCFVVGIGKYFKNQRLLVKQATYVEAGWGSYTMVGIIFCFACTVMILSLMSAQESVLKQST